MEVPFIPIRKVGKLPGATLKFKYNLEYGSSEVEIHKNDIDLEGACEGSLACSTCHVIIEPSWFSRLNLPSWDEEDMLDLASILTPTSRLGCQILLTEKLAGLVVYIPSFQHDVRENEK